MSKRPVAERSPLRHSPKALQTQTFDIEAPFIRVKVLAVEAYDIALKINIAIRFSRLDVEALASAPAVVIATSSSDLHYDIQTKSASAAIKVIIDVKRCVTSRREV
ncbi:hypothetical protein NDU88_000514 [Pleurodeles waltl]|uniref:Uncharacterized protein n=1 Tax=Pleurodeles waltl TaxID=8319 RepID=A0AAV7LWQ2_PLEWA|nr:hypothetical protein NDU88_000514 [Pleurodeles waltl]